jgi:hypothetical protein
MATKVEELLQEINDTLEDTANSLNPGRHRDFIGLDDVLEQLISAAREEGRAEERERIRAANTGTYFTTEYTIPKAAFDVPASLLAPAPKEGE